MTSLYRRLAGSQYCRTDVRTKLRCEIFREIELDIYEEWFINAGFTQQGGQTYAEDENQKALRKRFRKTATGKIIHLGAGHGHLMTTKSRKRKRNARNKRTLDHMEQKRIVNLF